MTSHVIGEFAGAIPEPLLRAESVAGKFFLMFFAIALFAVVFGLVLFLASLFKGRTGEKCPGRAVRRPRGPAPRGRPDVPRDPHDHPVVPREVGRGLLLDSRTTSQMFTQPELLLVLRNTAIWVILVPFLATGVGLVYAILIDRARGEAFSKALIFLPMAISMVGASIIWKFVYQYKQTSRPQIGLLNAILKALGFETQQFLINAPLNTLMLIIVMVWIQAGFAMTVLSAAIKAIPDEIIEAAKLDGVQAFKMFRFITLPSIRPALVVVITTIGIGTLKVFDIVRTMTGGQFDTSVVANEFYNQSFRYDAGRSRRGARGAAVRPRHPDRRLQHRPDAQGGLSHEHPRAHRDAGEGHHGDGAHDRRRREEAAQEVGRRRRGPRHHLPLGLRRRDRHRGAVDHPDHRPARHLVPRPARHQHQRVVDVVRRPGRLHARELPRRRSPRAPRRA